MKKIRTFLVSVTLCAGCATYSSQALPVSPTTPPAPQRQVKPSTKKMDAHTYRMAAFKRLDRAIELLQQGNVTGATKLLKSLVAGKGMPGVTDEALFRLALLSLKAGPDKPVSKQGLHYLKRLGDEYPSSSWTAQAAPLLELIDADEELRQQNRTLKATNQSLSKKITELNENIQQLKHLDLELEQKNK